MLIKNSCETGIKDRHRSQRNREEIPEINPFPRCQDHSVGKGLFSTINVRKIVYPHAREKNWMDPHLTQQTKTNSQWRKI